MNIALGVVLGVVVVVLFLGSTPAVLGPLVKASPQLSPATALIFFGTKTVAAIIALLLLFDVGGVGEHVDPTAFGLAAAATSIVWTTVLLLRFRNDRTPTYDLGDDSE